MNNNNKWVKKRVKKAEKRIRQPTMREALLNPFGARRKPKKKEVKKKTESKYVVIKGKAYKVAKGENNDKEEKKKLSPLEKRLKAREKIRRGMFGV